MTDVSLELQGAIYTALANNTAVGGLVADRIYDRVPKAREFPYVSFGPVSALSDDADCITTYELTVQIDAWSRTVGSVECKQIADAVRRALGVDGLTLTNNALVVFEHRVTRYLSDPDGLTTHAAITFTAFVEQGA
jgi:hypothetical protein